MWNYAGSGIWVKECPKGTLMGVHRVPRRAAGRIVVKVGKGKIILLCSQCECHIFQGEEFPICPIKENSSMIGGEPNNIDELRLLAGYEECNGDVENILCVKCVKKEKENGRATEDK